jgi:ribosomal protein L37AE/L43A
MKRDELIQKSREVTGYSNRLLLRLIILLVMFAGLLWWATIQKNFIPERTLGVIGLAGLFGGVYGGVIIVGILASRQRARLGLQCPACKKYLLGTALSVAIASGRCGGCGNILLEDWNK